jgi:hypothetical protein
MRLVERFTERWPQPNESRLSCGAKLERSQTQFYHRRRAPSASGAC